MLENEIEEDELGDILAERDGVGEELRDREAAGDKELEGDAVNVDEDVAEEESEEEADEERDGKLVRAGLTEALAVADAVVECVRLRRQPIQVALLGSSRVGKHSPT